MMKIYKFKNLSGLRRIKNQDSGYAIIELLFYIAFFAMLTLVVTNALLLMTRSFRETSVYGELLEGGNMMERISRELRQAYGISSIGSTNLTLNSTNDLGQNKTVQFLLSGGDLVLKENGATVGNLNPPTLSVSGLSFTLATTPKGAAVKVFYSVQSTSDTLGRTADFYDTVVLRGDYQAE